MYSPSIVQRNIERLEARTREAGSPVTIKRYPVADSIGLAEELTAIRDGDRFLRPLVRAEQEFIRNEQILSHLDFEYWAARYCTIDRDPETGGGAGPMSIWETQRIALAIISKVEEMQADAVERGETADGIRIAFHKARQLGATMLFRAMVMHRHTLHHNVRAMAASVDDDKILELYRRDKLIWEHLPWFLKPDLNFDVKAEHLAFDGLNSHILYQQSRQQSGLGQGRQFNGVSHLTECASWPYPGMIEMDFFPTLPRSQATLVGLESTGNGRGNWWHEFSEQVRRGFRVDWVYVFIPYYAEPGKYRRTPPVGWQPSELSILHAEKIYETSAEFVGKQVLLPREQLYWYETERAAYQKNGKLNVFLSNWCATPEEGFQHTNVSAFPAEFLEQARLTAKAGAPYEMTSVAT